MGKQICFTIVWGCAEILFSPVWNKMTSNTHFPEFKTTRDKKHDLETYIEDLIDYCIMQNWYETSKEGEAAKWTKSDWRVSPVRKRIRSRILRKDKTLSDKHWSGLQRSNRCLLMSVFFLTVSTKTCKIWDDGSETSGFSPVHFRFVAN